MLAAGLCVILYCGYWSKRQCPRAGTALMIRLFVIAAAICLAIAPASAVEPPLPLTPAQRGYQLLINKAYLPADFDQETIEAVWKQWPEPLRSVGEQASSVRRREMTF